MLTRWPALLAFFTFAANVALAGYFLFQGGPIWCLVLSLAAGLSVVVGTAAFLRKRSSADPGDGRRLALPNVNTEQAMPRHEPTPASSASHYLPMVDNSLRESEGAGADARRDSEPTSADAEETAAEGSGLAEIVSAEAAGPSPSEAEPELDPLRNQAWVNLVEEIVEFFEEVDRVRFEGHRDADDFADHVCCRLEEILQRSGVTIISNETVFDRTRHVPQGAVARGNAGDAILETLSPGFSVGRRVFRRALVRLADPDSLSPGAAP